ncbi:hypothetical protein F0562_008452 [Nyssa sinensis]|uniref:Reticulon-like protein n=1 Tax=Nyssa sinensis TaxID=561372 RepID=A0A5J5A5F5_9ASTE|nr:hypothetical protein F0562_008452 [Nyssa sinensis]
MDSTPPSHRSEPRLRTKSASRLARFCLLDGEREEASRLSRDLVPSSPKIATLSPSSPSPKPPNSLPLHKILLLSPSPLRRSKTRLTESLEMSEEPQESNGSRRRCKNRNSSMGLLGCASPRNGRRSRRRLEQEIQEERDFGMEEEMPKARKRRHSGRSKKEKLSLVPSIPSRKINDGDRHNLDRIGQLFSDIIMWSDVSKSSLWFGFGSLCFLSSCFSRGINFSFFSVISQLGLLFLGISFFSNSIRQRDNIDNKRDFKLKEDDILRAARVILPAANLLISKTRELFSGEPSMTLKVAPFLLVGAEYGHLITLWRLCALGFFISFTGPKLYSCYSVQINRKVEYLKWWVSGAWGACSHKKIVAASAATAFWNLTTIKTRTVAAFIALVMLRYYRQHSEAKAEEVEGEQEEELKQQALVVVEKRSLQ